MIGCLSPPPKHPLICMNCYIPVHMMRTQVRTQGGPRDRKKDPEIDHPIPRKERKPETTPVYVDVVRAEDAEQILREIGEKVDTPKTSSTAANVSWSPVLDETWEDDEEEEIDSEDSQNHSLNKPVSPTKSVLKASSPARSRELAYLSMYESETSHQQATLGEVVKQRLEEQGRWLRVIIDDPTLTDVLRSARELVSKSVRRFARGLLGDSSAKRKENVKQSVIRELRKNTSQD